MLRIWAIIFGIGFIFTGVAGFLPTFTVNGLLFGYFEVNVMHNIAHLATGVVAIMAATRLSYARLYFQVIGVVYAVIAILGFWREGNLWVMQVNMADNILHTVVGLAAMYLGFATKSKSS